MENIGVRMCAYLCVRYCPLILNMRIYDDDNDDDDKNQQILC